jgi:hypothetical protein
VATIVTATEHYLTTGTLVDISGFISGAASAFNVQQQEVTVVNATTFTFPNVGTNLGTTTDTSGVVSNLKGLGDLNGPYDCIDEFGNRIINLGTLNSMVINGDNLTRSLKVVAGLLPITFRLWSNKTLVFQGTVSSSDVFRLPTGYRSDTFEIAVSGSARVRAIHIGETPFGLRTA